MVEFSADAPHQIDIQPNLIRRAIRNLVDNALKYAGGAEVAVAGQDGGVTIAVLDRGPGLAPEELDRVGGAFYRAEPSRNRETGGAGLGLSIAQAIVDAHGGTLTLANRERGGLAATIALPRR
jgi:signal transduction histidine kinase